MFMVFSGILILAIVILFIIGCNIGSISRIIKDLFKLPNVKDTSKLVPNHQSKWKRTTGFIVLSLSVIWGVVLLVCVKSYLGQKFLVLSGSNVFDEKGFALSGNTHLLLWIVTVICFCIGAWLAINSLIAEKAKSISDRQKTCPMCAEMVLKEAKICKHCKHEFEEV